MSPKPTITVNLLIKYINPWPCTGYGGSLFGGGAYDKEDEEADIVYESIDKRMDERRKIKREERLLEEIKRYRMEKPKIQQQFEDIKRELGTMSSDDWSAIPDVSNMTRTKKNKVGFSEFLNCQCF